MRILQLAYKSEIHGGERVLLDLSLGLLARGHELHVVSTAPGPLLDLMAQHGAKTAVVPLPKTYDIRGVRQLAQYMKQERIELAQSHGLLVNVARRLAGRLAGVPLGVSTVHVPLALAQGGRSNSFKERLKSRYYRALDNFTSRWDTRVVCVSEAVRQDVLAQGISPAKAVTIRNGIDLDRFAFAAATPLAELRRQLKLPVDAPLLGTAARLSAQKDIHTLIRAMPGLWREQPAARLLLMGSGPQEAELHALAASLDTGGRICFLGHREDAVRLIAALDVFCLPTRYEGLPISVLEAMACARPVLCSPEAGTLEAVVPDETALLAPTGDVDAWASALRRLLGTPPLRQRLGQAGQVRVAQYFTRERMVAEAAVLYDKMLAER